MRFRMLKNSKFHKQVAAILTVAMVMTGFTIPAAASESEDVFADSSVIETALETEDVDVLGEEAVYEEEAESEDAELVAAEDVIEIPAVNDEVEAEEVVEASEEDIVGDDVEVKDHAINVEGATEFYVFLGDTVSGDSIERAVSGNKVTILFNVSGNSTYTGYTLTDEFGETIDSTDFEADEYENYDHGISFTMPDKDVYASIESVETETGLPSATDAETFVFKGMKAKYDASKKLCYGIVTGGNVKLVYKIPGAKFYEIARVSYVKTGAKVTMVKTLKDNYKTKKFQDKTFNGKDLGLYFVAGYDGSGNMVDKYVILPTTRVITANSIGKDVQVEFVAMGHGCQYVIERAEDSKFKKGYESFTVSDDQLTPSIVAGKKSFIYTDKDKAMVGVGNLKKKLFYRVTVKAKVSSTLCETTDLESKVSNKQGCYGERYSAPTIVDIEGTSDPRDGYYRGSVIWFTISDNFIGQADDDVRSSKVTYEVYKTTSAQSNEMIKSVKGTNLRAKVVDGKIRYGINTDGMVPETHASYSIIAKKNSSKSEMSNYYYLFYSFPDVDEMTLEPINTKSVRLKWESASCATSYAIYRTKNGYSTVSEAAVKMQKAYDELLGGEITQVKGKDLKKYEIKKCSTVLNEMVSGSELTATVNGLKSGLMYAFLIVPVNDKAYGYDDAGLILSDATISSPKTLSFTDKGMSGFKLKWNKISKAEGYLVERVTSDDQAILDQLKGTEDWYELFSVSGNYLATEYPSSQNEITITSGDGKTMETAKPGVSYAYRVLSIYTVNGTRYVTPGIRDKFRICCIGPKAVKDLSASMVTREVSGVTYWDNGTGNTAVKKKTISGDVVKARGVEVKFTVADKKNTDHYEVGRSDDDGWTFKSLGKLVPGTANSADTYKSASTEITFYDHNLARGVEYVYRVRPVASDGTAGVWKTVDFSVLKNWKVYAKKNSNFNNDRCTTTGSAMPINAGATERFYFRLDPSEPTYMDYDVSTSKGFVEAGRGTEKINDYTTLYYVDITAPESIGTKALIKFKYKRRYDEKDKGKVEATPTISMYLKTQ